MAEAIEVIEDRTLEAGESVSGLQFGRLSIGGSYTAHSDDPAIAPLISDISVMSLALHTGCNVSGADLRRIRVGRLKAPARDAFVFGCRMREVTLSGIVDNLILNTSMAYKMDAEKEENYRAWAADADGPGFSLDISRAVGRIEIRGYPARRMVLNPELHAIVSLDAARSAAMRRFDFLGTSKSASVDMLRSEGWEDAVLIANPRDKRNIDDELRVIDALRREGLAE